MTSTADGQPHAVRRRGRLLPNVVPPLILLVIIVAVWDLAVRFGLVSEYILPVPWEVLASIIGLGGGAYLWENMWVTTFETVGGFLLGSGLAFIIAVISGMSPLFSRMVAPYMIAFQVMPRVAIAPIIIAWLGFGAEPKIVLAATICFFPVYINTFTGIRSVDSESLELYRSLRASRWQTLRQLILPSALPVTFAGLKTAMTLALIGAIVGEFVSAQEGMGVLVKQFSFQLNMAAAFAVLLYLTLLGLLLYLFMEFIDTRLVFWGHDRRLDRMTARHQERQRRKDGRPPASSSEAHITPNQEETS
jgi:NitT/TauT family transport system permease protein